MPVEQLLLQSLSFIQLMLLKPDYRFKEKSEELVVNNTMESAESLRLFLLMKELLLSIKVLELHGWEKHHTHHLELVFMSQLRNGQVLIKKEQDSHKNSQQELLLEQSDLLQETHLMYWRQEWWLTNQHQIIQCSNTLEKFMPKMVWVDSIEVYKLT